MKLLRRFLSLIYVILLLSFTVYSQGHGNGGSGGGGSTGGGGTGGNGGNGGGGNGGAPNGGGNGANGQTPSVTVGANTGVIESYVLAAHAVRGCAVKLNASLTGTDTTSVVIFDQNQHDILNALSGFQIQNTIASEILRNSINQYDQLPSLPPDLAPPARLGVTDAIPVANALMQSLVNLISLFRTDITVGGTVVNLDDEIFIDEVANAIKPIKTFRPSLYFTEVLDPNSVANSAVVTSLRNLYQQRQQASLRIAKVQVEMAALTSKLRAATNDDDRTRINSFLSPRNDALTSLQAAVAIFDSFISRLTGGTSTGTQMGNAGGSRSDGGNTGGGNQGGAGAGGARAGASGGSASGGSASGGSASGSGAGGSGAGGGSASGGSASGGSAGGDNGGGNSGNGGGNTGPGATPQQGGPTLADLVMAELLIGKIKSSGTRILVLHIEQSGGGYMTKSNIWTFFGGAKLFHSGGTITTFALLLPATGEVLAAGSCPAYSGYIKNGDVTKEISKP
jgi:hypothetical protein